MLCFARSNYVNLVYLSFYKCIAEQDLYSYLEKQYAFCEACTKTLKILVFAVLALVALVFIVILFYRPYHVILFLSSYLVFMLCHTKTAFSNKYPFISRFFKFISLVLMVYCSFAFVDVFVIKLLEFLLYVNGYAKQLQCKGSNNGDKGPIEKSKSKSENPREPRDPKGPKDPVGGHDPNENVMNLKTIQKIYEHLNHPTIRIG